MKCPKCKNQGVSLFNKMFNSRNIICKSCGSVFKIDRRSLIIYNIIYLGIFYSLFFIFFDYIDYVSLSIILVANLFAYPIMKSLLKCK